MFIAKIMFWSFPVYSISQLFHESGHMWAGLLAGYKINYMTITLSGSHVNMTITSSSTIVYKIVLFAGGITSAFLLSIIYTNIKKPGAEFTLVIYTFILIEAAVSLIESLMTTYYKTHPTQINLLVLPAFIISAIVHREKLPEIKKKE